MDMFVTHACCEVTKLCEQIVEEVAIISIQHLFEALCGVEKLVFVEDQRAQARYDL